VKGNKTPEARDSEGRMKEKLGGLAGALLALAGAAPT
jgi:hypothetical protein